MRNLAIDYLKVVLAFLVLVLHSEIFLHTIPTLGFVLINGVCRIAVPLFLLISGYYFVYITTFDRLKKWLARLSLLYLLWMLVYSPFWFDVSNLRSLMNLATGFAALWYFPGLIIAGAMLYLMRNLRMPILLTMASILYLAGFAIQQLGNMHVMSGRLDVLFNWYPFYRNAVFDCFPILVLGYVMRRDDLWCKLKIRKWHVAAVLMLIVVESMANYAIVGNESLDMMLFLPLGSVVIFLYVKNLSVCGAGNNVAMFSVAVFLIHPLWFFIYIDLNIGAPRFAFVLLMTIISSTLLVAANKRLKYIL
ncbi:acyltransferase family protein [Kluyvera huaxiensis]|uniref:acyltransferase family protein n=1 Tax=Kluyvera sp. 142053 TaxID=3160979 RepID=UPI0032DFE7E5